MNRGPMPKGKFPEPKKYPRRAIVGVAMTTLEREALVEEADKRGVTYSTLALHLMRNGDLRQITTKKFGDEATKMYEDDDSGE